jgi:hypothetical protein
MIETIHLQLLSATFAGWVSRELIVRMAKENPSCCSRRTWHRT